MAELSFRSYGARSGVPLAVLHGWATDHHFTQPIASLFPGRQILICDLPGYGISKPLKSSDRNLDATAKVIIGSLPDGCDLMAWSISSIYALKACALAPKKFRSFISVCGSPRFPEDPAWPGFPFELILKCMRYFTPERYEKLLKLFFSMQGRNNDRSTAVNTFLKECTKVQNPVSFDILRAQLDDMRETDLRADLDNLEIPSLYIFGRYDRLVPCAIADLLRDPFKRQCEIFEKSAHLPYLTEPRLFAKTVNRFCDSLEKPEAKSGTGSETA